MTDKPTDDEAETKLLENACLAYFGPQFPNFSASHRRAVKNRMRRVVAVVREFPE